MNRLEVFQLAPCTALLLALLLTAAVSPALADGMILAQALSPIWEPGQKALILHDAQAGIEDLTLQVNFYGDATDFAWIVPLPSAPTLDEPSNGIFNACSELTKPIQHDRHRTGWGCYHQMDYYPVPGEDNGVDILAEQTVGIYQTLTLSADDAGALADSLSAWGYLHAGNEDAVEAALQYYIDKSWCFMAMKVDSSFAWDPDGNGYWGGQLEPIRIRFASPEIVYPLRISAVSTLDDNHVLLYVAAEHRMSFPGARTEYANAITESELATIRQSYPDLGLMLARPCFLTKLRRGFLISEMTEDLVLTQAPNDDEFREVYYGGYGVYYRDYGASIPVAELGLLGFVAWQFSRARWRGRGKSK